MNFSGVDISAVSKIEFAFSQEVWEKPLKTAEYPNKDAIHIADNLFGIVWTAEDTKKFEAGKEFYCDTRISLKGTSYQPETPILKLKMNPTLFER